MTKRQKRMIAVFGLLAGLSLAAVLGFTAFNKNMMYFYTPSDLGDGKTPPGATLRLGGLVERGSLVRSPDSLKILFTMADCTSSVKVRYEGILPDLFREGQGVVATGSLDEHGEFVAKEILAKHDENYMPPQLASSLKGADGKHTCEPFKRVSGVSQKPRLQTATSVPLPFTGEGRADGGAVGGVRAASAAPPPSNSLPQGQGGAFS